MHDSRADSVVRLLSDPDRRAIVEYFYREGNETASVDELAAHLAERGASAGRGRPVARQTAIRLHHFHLPQLDDEGVLDYDPRSRMARYESDEQVEAVLDSLTVAVHCSGD